MNMGNIHTCTLKRGIVLDQITTCFDPQQLNIFKRCVQKSRYTLCCFLCVHCKECQDLSTFFSESHDWELRVLC